MSYERTAPETPENKEGPDKLEAEILQALELRRRLKDVQKAPNLLEIHGKIIEFVEKLKEEHGDRECSLRLLYNILLGSTPKIDFEGDPIKKFIEELEEKYKSQ